MIYQLIRRDPAWKAMPWLALVSAVVLVCPPPAGPDSAAFLAMMALVYAVPHRRASRFEAGLPIEVRDLLLARTLSLMALIWIPALSGAAGIVIVRGSSTLAAAPLAVGALCTLIAAVAQAAWLKELSGPMWIFYALFALPVTGLMMLKHPVPLVPPLCALAGVGLFAWAWVAVPRSFQLSSAGPKAYNRTGRVTVPLPAFRWTPVLRSVCCWQYLFPVTVMAFQAFSRAWLFAPFWLMAAWQGQRVRTRWLGALPVRSCALLWTILGPMLASQVLGYLVGRRVHPQAASVYEPRVVVVMLAALLGYEMITILCCVLIDWRGFAHIPRRILIAVFFSLYVGWYGAALFAMYRAPHGGTWQRDALVQLGRMAPMGLPALIAIAAAVLIALYWAIEKVFSEPDFADKPKVNQPGAFA